MEHVILPSLKATASVALISLTGVVMAKKGVLTKEVCKGISGLVANVLTPCLVTSKIIPVVSVDNILSLSPLIIFAVMNVLWGCCLGYILARFVLRLPKRFHWFSSAVCGFANTTSIPLGLVTSLSFVLPALKLDPEESDEITSARGTSFVLLFTIFVTILRWTVGYRMMGASTDPEDSENKYETKLLEEMEKDEAEDDAESLEAPESLELTIIEMSNSKLDIAPRPTHELANPLEKKKLTFGEQLRKSITPPVVASVVAIAIALINPIRGLFADNKAPLGFVMKSINTLGGATVPLVLMSLGFKIAQGPMPLNKDGLPRSLLIGVCAVRFIISPILGVSSVLLTHRVMGFLADPMLRFQLMVQSCMPPAIVLTILCSLHGKMEREMGTLLFYAYLAGLVFI
eukprot:Colp12_sorted_trinity150504_noHs@1992